MSWFFGAMRKCPNMQAVFHGSAHTRFDDGHLFLTIGGDHTCGEPVHSRPNHSRNTPVGGLGRGLPRNRWTDYRAANIRLARLCPFPRIGSRTRRALSVPGLRRPSTGCAQRPLGPALCGLPRLRTQCGSPPGRTGCYPGAITRTLTSKPLDGVTVCRWTPKPGSGSTRSGAWVPMAPSSWTGKFVTPPIPSPSGSPKSTVPACWRNCAS
jgi:hypothetical protein